MGAARSETVDELREQFTADDVQIAVEPYAYAAEAIDETTVFVRLERVTLAPEVPAAARKYVFDLVVVTPLSEAGPADDELDQALEDVLHAIDKHPQFQWEQADRAVFESTQTPCYRVTVTRYTAPTPTNPTP